MRQGNKRVKSITAMLLAVVMLIGSVPAAMAAQSNEYVDPADKWLSASGRTNELDVTLTLPATEHKAYIVGYPDGTICSRYKKGKRVTNTLFLNNNYIFILIYKLYDIVN